MRDLTTMTTEELVAYADETLQRIEEGEGVLARLPNSPVPGLPAPQAARAGTQKVIDDLKAEYERINEEARTRPPQNISAEAKL